MNSRMLYRSVMLLSFLPFALLGQVAKPGQAVKKPAGKNVAPKKAVVKKPAKPEVIQLTFADNGKAITAQPDQVIRISLPANASTGYSWNLENPENKNIKQMPGDYVSNPNKEKMVGVDGTQVLVFKTLKPGWTEIQLAYSRSWEIDKKSVQEFKVRFNVN